MTLKPKALARKATAEPIRPARQDQTKKVYRSKKETILVQSSKAVLTETNDAERISADSGTSLGGFTHLLGSGEFLAFADHVGQPIGASVKVKNQTQSRISHFFNSVSRNVANGNAEFTGCFHINVVNSTANTNDDSKCFEFLQIFFGQSNGVPHEGPDSFIQDLQRINIEHFILLYRILIITFSCISVVLCASQNATVATSFKIGISMEQSRPSSRATNGRLCKGPVRC